MADRSIVVVGAGIVGASLAYHLAGRERPVTLIDAELPGSGATRASFAWIGRPVSSDLPSASLRYLALDEYRRLETELPELSIRWSGSLSWDGFDETPGAITRDAGSLEPHLLNPPAEAGHRPEDAAFDPLATTELLVAAARDRGAQLLTGTPAIALDHQAGAVSGVRTTAGVLSAGTVVLAAGTGTVALCSGIGVTLPVESSPAILVRLRATPGLVRAIVATPSLEARQLDDGTILAPTTYSGETDQAALLETARRVRDRFAASFAGAGDTEVVSVEIGWRPMPTDGEPIIGRPAGTQGLYVAVMHSAITLAAAVGRLAADEILTGVPAPELAGCRPDRFQ
ncbi:NAD(P)/FAD-dependent oxidoreductase [Kribbella shirazensis]|uniref:Glycine/D-amino acid oxidase-like deaminating enzyme n=1 Tax=Kribbella shirazensis TaxID=1105143 RepID=A0A7X5VEP0_9ACTN|nr:FAD-binding oxidoreductase [Kribbella shirazensis]NIK59844.1 glycine/D-amino acid oxidase-like deaminating enzyme [Kribbella shirazensis]